MKLIVYIFSIKMLAVLENWVVLGQGKANWIIKQLDNKNQVKTCIEILSERNL